MAKFSISVPDHDWEQARAVGRDLNASQLVQAALRQYVENRATKPTFAQHPPADTEGLVATARERLTVQARTVFEEGYRAGAQLANEDLGWGALDLLADYHWNYRQWLAALRQDYQQYRWFGDLYGYFESLTEDTGFAPGSAWEAGFAKALRDVWQAVMEDRLTATNDGSGKTEDA